MDVISQCVLLIVPVDWLWWLLVQSMFMIVCTVLCWIHLLIHQLCLLISVCLFILFISH